MIQFGETIIALATPEGMGAIAVFRLSGPQAIEAVEKVFKTPGGKPLSLQDKAGYTIHFGALFKGDTVLDEVLVSLFKGPKSYTGEDVVEISTHGSVYLQREVLKLFLSLGVKMAQPGEFTLRAFTNGKMDLSQAEAVADLIASENAAGAKVAMNQMKGGFSKDLQALREELIQFASLIELELDFGEEDVEFANRDQLNTLLDHIESELNTLVGSFSLGNAIKNGIPVAIIGAPNAGKSTLLNALLKEERAIVSSIAGTTRDTIEDEIHLGGLTFRFIDTAGIRETQDEIEHIGVKKAYEKVALASIILYLYDAKQPPQDLKDNLAEIKSKAQGKPVIVVANKSEEMNTPLLPEALAISALRGMGIEELQNALLAQVETSKLNNNQTIVTNARHYQELTDALESVVKVKEGLALQIPGDLLAMDVRTALRHLGNITGHIDVDRDILGTIFGKFCIGK